MKYSRAMKVIRLFLAAASFTSLCAASAQAQSILLYVSSSGNDMNACNTPAAACATMSGAQSKAGDGATIVCVNPGFYGGIGITLSLTIDCLAGGGGLHLQFVTIDAPGTRVVTLRNLAINGFSNNAGVDIITGSTVHLENVSVRNANGPAVRDLRTGPGKLFISDSNFVFNSGPGILVAPQNGTGITAVLDNVRVRDSSFGLAVGSGGRVLIKRSVFSGNTRAGIEADAGAIIAINETLVSANPTGILANPGASVALSNSDIDSNSTAISGTTRSYGNNRIFANSNDGTPPSPVGSPSSENGQR